MKKKPESLTSDKTKTLEIVARVRELAWTERLSRTNINELPRFAGVDQQDARDLRSLPAAE